MLFFLSACPERIRIGIVDQIVHGEDPVCNEPLEDCATNPGQGLCKYIDQVDLYEMKAELSVGPVFARHIGHVSQTKQKLACVEYVLKLE